MRNSCRWRTATGKKWQSRKERGGGIAAPPFFCYAYSPPPPAGAGRAGAARQRLKAIHPS